MGPTAATMVAAQGPPEAPNRTVFLTPPFNILSATGGPAAMLIVDYRAQSAEVIRVFEDYGGDDSEPWNALVAYASRQLAGS